MDIMLSGAAAPALRIGAQVAQWGIRSMASNQPQLYLEMGDITGLVELDSGEQVVITAAQSRDIQRFLRDPAVTAFIRILFLQNVATDPADLSFLNDTASSGVFQGLIDRWCDENRQDWRSLAPLLLEEISKQQRALTQRLKADGSPARRDAIDNLLQRFFFGFIGERHVPEFIARIHGILEESSRLAWISHFLTDANLADRESRAETFEIMGADGEDALFRQLFVDRQLTDSATGESISAQDVLDVSQASPRVVIIGDPGVGKSTLTAWAKWRLLSSQGHQLPAIVTITCRYDLMEPGSRLLEALRRSFESKYATALEPTQILDILALGSAMLVVDGIDEILDSSHRKQTVRDLNRLAEKYPFVPIIVTTRKTGTEVSLFERRVFRVMNLEQYTDDQVEDYARRWFRGHQSSPVKVERFLGESASLSEIRRNPLMLALLCTLFSQSDYIPESRRDIYLRCAQLMFFEWDPKRGIRIPKLFKNRGEAILREIALTLYRSGGVGRSIDEKQLSRLIEGYLADKGLEKIEAASAAAQLIDHCSKRAWILSKVSTPDTIAHFAFTHRTFFEFFTAEALIRKIGRQSTLGQEPPPDPAGLTPVAREIVTAFIQDSTSVLPELLMQAAEDLLDGMGNPVLDEIRRYAQRPALRNVSEQVKRSHHAHADLLSLCIRLVAAGGASSTVVDQIFDLAETRWTPRHPVINRDQGIYSQVNSADLRPLLDVNKHHRNRFVERCLAAPNGLGQFFLRRYARLFLSGSAGLYDEQWLECAKAVANKLPFDRHDACVISFLWDSGEKSLTEALRGLRSRHLVEIDLDQEAFPGLLWHSLRIGLTGDECERLVTVLHGDATVFDLTGHHLAELAAIAGITGPISNPMPHASNFLLLWLTLEDSREALARVLGAGDLVDGVADAHALGIDLNFAATAARIERDTLESSAPDGSPPGEELRQRIQDLTRRAQLAHRRLDDIHRTATGRNAPAWLKEQAGLAALARQLREIRKMVSAT